MFDFRSKKIFIKHNNMHCQIFILLSCLAYFIESKPSFSKNDTKALVTDITEARFFTHFQVYSNEHLEIHFGFPSDVKNRNILSSNGLNFGLFYLQPKFWIVKTTENDGSIKRVPHLKLIFYLGPFLIDLISAIVGRSITGK